MFLTLLRNLNLLHSENNLNKEMRGLKLPSHYVNVNENVYVVLNEHATNVDVYCN